MWFYVIIDMVVCMSKKREDNQQEEMYKIYIMLSFTGTWFSRMLRIFTRGKYVHVGFSFDDSLLMPYSFGRKNPRLLLPAGFTKEDLRKISKIHKKVDFLVYELVVTKKQYDLLQTNLSLFEKEKDKYHYNILGLGPIFFGRPLKREHHYVCSQFVGKLFQDSGIYDFHKDYSLIRPLDFTKMDNKKMVYCGNLAEFLEMKEELI